MQAVRTPRRGASAHADDRPHARRARRADDLRAEAGALVRGAGARRRAHARAPARRSSVGKLSGAVGTFAHLPPSIEADVCRTLGLEPAPVASQVIQRDRHAELHVGAGHHRRRRSRSSRSRSAACRRPRSARSRSRSPRARRARRRCRTSAIRSAASRSSAWRGCCAPTPCAALENNALWHERDISHSSVERVILPDSFIVLDHMLRRFTRIVAGMVVYPERMRENLERSRGVVFSGTVLLELARARRVARAGLRVGAAQRHARLSRAARFQGAAAGRRRCDAACCRRPRSSARSTSTSSCSTSTRSSTGCSRAPPSCGDLPRAGEPA